MTGMPSPGKQFPSELMQQAAHLHRRGELEEAEKIYRSVLTADPGHFAALYYIALVHAQRGDPDSAIPLFRLAIARNPRVAEIHNNLGMALFATRHYQEAIGSYAQAISLNPLYAVAHNNLGSALGALGRHEDALSRFEQALSIKPDYVEALNNFGTECFALGRYRLAIDYFQRAVALRPDFADAQLNLGNALLADDRPQAALESYQKASELKGHPIDLRQRMGDLLEVLNRREEALELYDQALREHPDSLQLRLKRGNVLQMLNRHDEAVSAYREVLATHPDNCEAFDCLGFAQAELGDSAGARQAFESALHIEPTRMKSLFGLVNSTAMTEEDPAVHAMKSLSRNTDGLSSSDRILLHFALGKAFADTGQHLLSFDHLNQGNALRRRELKYDEAATLSRFESIRSTFTHDFLRHNTGNGNYSRRPIFIVGMMRSGTTLVEQILASHPRVFAAGELLEFQESVTESIGPLEDSSYLRDFQSKLTPQILRNIGSKYLERVHRIENSIRFHRSDATSAEQPLSDRITDKLPTNFLWIGLIHLVFPNAAILHTRRDPVDTCLSCFSNLFSNSQPYTYDLGELGRYYRAYAQLMTHWRQVLPVGAMLDVRYELLVNDLETEARRIVEYCGLEWDEACLQFHKTPRAVRTASMSQVRRPIYRTSVGRPRPNAASLQPLLDALGEQ
jgi:tetratricopeptide (TPR) repeat protein